MTFPREINFTKIFVELISRKKNISLINSIHFIPVLGSMLPPNFNLLNFFKSNCELGGTNCRTITNIVAAKNTTEFNLKPLMVYQVSTNLELGTRKPNI